MQGTLVWYSAKKTQGIIVVTENGIAQKYFLLRSKISCAPEVVKSGQFVRFLKATAPPKPGLLPIALAVEISDTPFADVNPGVKALRAGAQ